MAAIKKTVPPETVQQQLTAKQFLNELVAIKFTSGDNSRFFHGEDKANKFLQVRMGNIFTLAKKFIKMPVEQIEILLDSDFYEARVGAVSIMDFQAREKKIDSKNKKALYDLYIKKHDRIDNWDLVDRSAPYVVGGYLFDQSRTQLYKLARSKYAWERRTAIVSTYYFIRQNDTDDTFKIAEILINDKNDLINKAVGSWIREAGKKDQQKLMNFLDKHAASMPRVTLRYAIEKLDKELKDYYMDIKG